MKKLFVYAGIACAAALSLTNCSKIDPQTPSSEGMPFEIVASTAETKTANDGLKTTWVENDDLNLFHAVAGSTAYGTNDQFTLVSGENFSGKLTEALDESKSYDWYALYPYNENIKTPAERTAGYVYVGGQSNQTQIQTGNDSKAHLIYNEKGNGLKNCPLYAVLKNVSASEKPVFQMKHLSSVVAVKVTNNSGNPLTVSKVAFSAPEGTTIVGAYLVDITGDTPDYSKIYKDYASNVANLTVNEGAAIANGASATFYLAVKPFKAAANTLKLAVNGYEKTPTATTNVEFKAGTIATVNFNYDNTSSSKQAVYSPSNFSGGTSGSAGTAMTVTNDDTNIELIATGFAKSSEIRLYAGDSFSVTAKNGVTITKIELETQSKYPGEWSATNGGGTVSGTTWEGSQTKTVTLKNIASKQAKITKITVTYE